MTARRRFRWPRYSLRTFFVLLSIVGAHIGWIGLQRRAAHDRLAMRAWLESQGAFVVIKSQESLWRQLEPRRDRPATRWFRKRSLAIIEEKQHGHGPLPQVRRWFGDEYVEGIGLPSSLDNRLAEVEQLFPESIVVSEGAEGERELRLALARPNRFELRDVPLGDALDYLIDLYGVEIRLDSDSLDKAEIDSEIPVSFQADGVSLTRALSGLLAPVKLVFAIDRQAVVVNAGLMRLSPTGL